MADVKWIIFDFDGTLADSVDMLVSVYNEVAPKYGYKIIKPEDRDFLRGKTAWQIKQALGVPWWKIPFMLPQARKLFNGRIGKINFFPGMKELVLELHQRNYQLGIFTTNTYESIDDFLQNNGCRDVFKFIAPKASLFYKVCQFKKALKKYKIDPASAIYIGDETKDVDAAKKTGAKSAAVSWGLNSKEALLSHHPDFLAETPEELLEIFKS